MNAIAADRVDAPCDLSLQASRADTGRKLYEAEWALHCAHQTGVDAWIAAASDRLHEAVSEYLSARAG
jgi:hypothetical protein